MPLWKFTTKNKRQCNGVFVERGMTVEVVTPTTSNSLHNPQGRETDLGAAFMTKYGVDMKKSANAEFELFGIIRHCRSRS